MLPLRNPITNDDAKYVQNMTIPITTDIVNRLVFWRSFIPFLQALSNEHLLIATLLSLSFEIYGGRADSLQR
jgi:hypothetical protein